MEIWKPIKGYEGLYEVSNLGQVRSVDRLIKHNFYDGVKCIRKGKLLKPCVTERGYLRVTLTNNGKREKIFIHRLVAQAFLDPVEGKNQVNHIDGDKTNNTVENLEWCTGKENMAHAFSHGLFDNFKKKKRKAVVRDDGVVFESIS